MSTRSPIVRLTLSRFLLLYLFLGALPVQAQSGLVGWWKFDEGSGTTAADSSGNGNSGTLSGSPTWVAGHTGPGALTFNGGASFVGASGSGALANLYTGGLTVSAWIRPNSGGGGGGGRIVDKDNNNSGWFFAMSNANTVKFTSDQDTTGVGSRTSSASITLNTWQHVLVTWTGAPGGTNMHIYINGVQADGGFTTASGSEVTDSSTPVTIGGRQVDATRGFDGGIDDVRIYNRVLTTAEIQALADATAPSAPSALLATAPSSSQTNLSWTAATDNIAVTGYLIERCQGSGCSNFAQIATSTGTSYTDTGLSPATSYTYRARATDAAGNLSGYSNTASVTTQSGSDTTPPSAPSGLTATAASSSQITLSWTASTDNVGVTGYQLERCLGASCTTFSQIATPTSTSYSDTGLTASTSYTYRVRATDAANNLSGYSAVASATTSAAGGTGPVGWWKFDEGTGTTTADASGNNYVAALVNGPTWSTGHVGPYALTFNGGTSEVTASGAGSLANLYSGGFTVAAWIYPTGAGGGSGGRIVDKDNSSDGWFFAMSGANTVKLTSDQDSAGTTTRASSASIVLNTWQHVVATWTGAAGGQNMHIYINGVQSDGGFTDGTGPETSDATTPLTIGNRQSDKARGFAGAIDDVRIYNRVLSASEIQALANPSAPTAPTSLASPASSSSQVNLRWTASTSSAGVSNYQVERCLGVGCTTFAQVGATANATTTYFDTTVAASANYVYRVRAKDANNALSPYSNTIAVTTAAGVAYTCPSTGSATLCYFYDDVGRLTVARRDDGAQQTYALDAAGNRLGTTAAAATPVSVPVLTVSGHTATSATLSWTLPTGGNGRFTYVVNRTSQPSPLIPSTTALSLTDSGLAPSTQYTYAVTVTDSDGNTATSAPVSVTTYAMPVITSFTGSTVSASSTSLTWAATDVGGPGGALTYSVKRSGTTTLGCTASPCADTGLAPGTSYVYTLTVTDSVGDSVSRDSSPVSTYPLPAVTLTAAPVSATSIRLTWSASDTGGPGGLTYVFKRGTTVISCPSSPCVDTGLSPATSYTYTFTATDSVGDPGTVTATQSTYSIPVVTSFTVTGVTTNSITMAWTATGGSGGLTFNITRNSNPIVITPSPFTDGGLSPNTTYQYTISVRDSAGDTSTGPTITGTTLQTTETPTITIGGNNTNSGNFGLNLNASIGIVEGSVSPATTSNGFTYQSLFDSISGAHGGIGWMRSVFAVSGLTADPTQNWLTSVTCLGVTQPGFSATTYTYSAGVATWKWTTGNAFGFAGSLGSTTTCSIVHQ